MKLRVLALAAVLSGLALGQADAQYYGDRRPPGYPPPYGYGPPGSRCDAFIHTGYGPRRVVCPMGRDKPVGAHCACPPPDGYGPTARGHVIP